MGIEKCSPLPKGPWALDQLEDALDWILLGGQLREHCLYIFRGL